MLKYIKKEPVVVKAKQITEQDYDGYVIVCAHHLDSLIFIDERLQEKEYENSCFFCDYEDDGHCLREGGECGHARKIGYIKLSDYNFAYPVVGDYMVVDENGKVHFMKAEQFEAQYEICCETF